MTGENTRVLIVDDHALFRESLGRLLAAEPDIEVLPSCGSTADALATIQTGKVDVILLDLDLGPETGEALCQAARAMGFRGRVLIVTAGARRFDVSRLIALGVTGVFLKHNGPAELLAAIHQVVEGGVYFDAANLPALFNAGPKATPVGPVALTAREQAVLRGVFDGFANKEIAASLSVSESSVKATVQQLFHKMGVRTRSQLVRVALERYEELM